MSISCYFGGTECGKSRHLERDILPGFSRVIIFDNARCFEGGDIYENPQVKDFQKMFLKYSSQDAFKIIIRPGRDLNDEILCDRTIKLALALGRCLGKGPKQRLQILIDEADFVCTSRYQSMDLKYLVNKGRHDNVDGHFIARNPNRIHTDIRANASKIISFRLTNASQIEFFLSNFTRENCRRIQTLEKYWRFEWSDTGKVEIFNDKNKKQREVL